MKVPTRPDETSLLPSPVAAADYGLSQQVAGCARADEEVTHCELATQNFHPVEHPGELEFELPSVKALQQAISAAMRRAELARTVYGAIRNGKSTTSRIIRKSLQRSGRALVFWSIQESGSDSSKDSPRLFRELRQSYTGELPFQSGGEKEALAKSCVALANSHQVRRVVFIIDEAQYLTQAQFIGLKALLDTLIGHRLSPFVLLFAQPDIFKRVELLSRSLDGHSLVERFFGNMIELPVPRLSDIAGMLRCFDEARYPEEGGPTYTQHYAPLAWQHGWRLGKQATHFQTAFRDVGGRFEQRVNEVPSEYLTRSVRGVLLRASEWQVTPDAFKSVVFSEVANCGIERAWEVSRLRAEAVADQERRMLLTSRARRNSL